MGTQLSNILYYNDMIELSCWHAIEIQTIFYNKLTLRSVTGAKKIYLELQWLIHKPFWHKVTPVSGVVFTSANTTYLG